jgi:hypothetical protein
MSQSSISHPVCRLSIRATTAGVFVTLSVFLTLLALIAAIPLWNLDLRELPDLSRGFWMAIFVAWILAIFSGGLVASRSISPQTGLNGILNSIVVWAASCVFVTTVLAMSTNEMLNFTHGVYSEGGPFWIVFAGNFIAFIASVFAGRLGGKDEHAIKSKIIREKREASVALPSAHFSGGPLSREYHTTD